MDETTQDVENVGTKLNQRSSRWKFPNSRLKLAFIVLAGLAIIALVFLVITGRIAATLKQPDQRMVVRSNVCGDDVVAKYNTAMSDIDTVDSVPTAVTDLITQFSKNSSYQNDSTCLYIEFATFIQKKDYTGANDIYEKVVRLADQGDYASTKLYNMAGLTGMKNNLSSIQSAGVSSSTYDSVDLGND